MRLRLSYTLKLERDLPEGFQIPLEIEVDNTRFLLPAIDSSNPKLLEGFVEVGVETGNLSLVTGKYPLVNGSPDISIDVLEKAQLSRFAKQITDLLSFLTDVPIKIAHKLVPYHYEIEG
jgi:hypothetical protein